MEATSINNGPTRRYERHRRTQENGHAGSVAKAQTNSSDSLAFLLAFMSQPWHFIRMRAAILGLAITALAFNTTQNLRADLPPLIPRDVLFGNPERTSPRLSPDGTRLAWIAPDKK